MILLLHVCVGWGSFKGLHLTGGWHGTEDPRRLDLLGLWHFPSAGVLWFSSMWPLSPHGSSSSRASLCGLTLQGGSLDVLTTWQLGSRRVRAEAVRLRTA